jgi:hypothetical protein
MIGLKVKPTFQWIFSSGADKTISANSEDSSFPGILSTTAKALLYIRVG